MDKEADMDGVGGSASCIPTHGQLEAARAQDGCSVPAEASNSVHAGLAPVPADTFPTGRRTIPTRDPSQPRSSANTILSLVRQ